MQRTVLGIAAACSLALSAAVPAAAQTIPPGSYQQSCTNIRVRGDQLIARCNAPQGGTVRTSISLEDCRRGDIANSNGQLVCNRDNRFGRGYGYGRGNNGYNNGYGNGYNNGYGSNAYAPSGSYQGSCTNVLMRGNILTASCTAANGARVTSSINVNRCRGGDIANDNGRLECR